MAADQLAGAAAQARVPLLRRLPGGLRGRLTLTLTLTLTNPNPDPNPNPNPNPNPDLNPDPNLDPNPSPNQESPAWLRARTSLTTASGARKPLGGRPAMCDARGLVLATTLGLANQARASSPNLGAYVRVRGG